MLHTKEYRKGLLIKYIKGTISPEEREQLFISLESEEQQDEWKALIEELSREMKFDFPYDESEWNPMIQHILKKPESVPVVRSIAGYRKWWWAAASIILLLGAGTYFMFSHKSKPVEIAKTVTPTDIKAPATNRAMITLANGQKIFLDSAGNGILATQNNISIIKTADGKIEYSGASKGERVGSESFNTLFNPRGSRVINLTLADGSKVWLNAESSLTYPTAFIGKERKVQITGEAYFEVAHISTSPGGGREEARPFTVSKGETVIRVLGTHFNVNAYDDEKAIKITLLQGSVEVRNEKSKVKITPGQQAVLAPGSEFVIHNAVNVDQVMAWKNGLFSFGKADLQTVMRQLTKWYDVDVVYQGNIPKQTFGGDIERTLSLSQVLKVLEKSDVHFKIVQGTSIEENKKIIVMP